MQTGHDVELVGCVLSACGRFLCSPDGLIGDDGGLELKNPAPKTQVKYLVKNELPSKYKCQVHGSLIVTGRKWWSFLSYCPGFAPLLVRVEWDEFTDLLRAELEKFHERYRAVLDRITAM